MKGKCTGGTGTIGYKIDEDKFYHLDPLTSPLVLEAFQRYDNGDKMVEIVNFLNDKGVRNMLGGKMTHSSVNTMLKNRRYIGELSFRDIVVPGAIPVIVPKDLFDRVQKRLDKNKRAPACGKADEEYLLTTKLFCGKCGALMFGESGTSATGRTYYYYKCANVKRRKGCNKKTVQKEWLEALIEIFVNAIFLYDDRMLITFNYKDGTQTVRFEDTLTADSAEEKSSDLFSSAGPQIQRFHVRNRWIFLFIGWPHLVLTTILTPESGQGRNARPDSFFFTM